MKIYKPCKILINCLYWMNADKITNYFGNTITKNRPLLCIDEKKINDEIYCYFLIGTTSNQYERRYKNFSKFFIMIEKDIINKLVANTHFQTNTIYVIKKEDIDIYTPRFIGKMIPKNITKVHEVYKNAFNVEVCIFSFYSNKYSKWIIGRYQSNFKNIASANNKNKKNTANIINRNISESTTMINKKFKKETINRIFSFNDLFK